VLARGQRFALPTGSTGFFKTENFKNWWQSVAVGNCSQLSTGSGWAVLQWKGWVKLEPVGLCPGLPWVQQLYPCLERATGCGAGTPNKNGPKGPQLI
jgi:hypothetical protein